MGGDEIWNNNYIMNNLGESSNLWNIRWVWNFSKCYHAQCFFFEFLIINYRSSSAENVGDDWRLEEGWRKVSRWMKMGNCWAAMKLKMGADLQSLKMWDSKMGVDGCCWWRLLILERNVSICFVWVFIIYKCFWRVLLKFFVSIIVIIWRPIRI